MRLQDMNVKKLLGGQVIEEEIDYWIDIDHSQNHQQDISEIAYLRKTMKI